MFRVPRKLKNIYSNPVSKNTNPQVIVIYSPLSQIWRSTRCRPTIYFQFVKQCETRCDSRFHDPIDRSTYQRMTKTSRNLNHHLYNKFNDTQINLFPGSVHLSCSLHYHDKILFKVVESLKHGRIFFTPNTISPLSF